MRAAIIALLTIPFFTEPKGVFERITACVRAWLGCCGIEQASETIRDNSVMIIFMNWLYMHKFALKISYLDADLHTWSDLSGDGSRPHTSTGRTQACWYSGGGTGSRWGRTHPYLKNDKGIHGKNQVHNIMYKFMYKLRLKKKIVMSSSMYRGEKYQTYIFFNRFEFQSCQNTPPLIILVFSSIGRQWPNIIGFPRTFSSSLHSILENVFSISSRTLWNVRMLVSISSFGRSILKHCYSISCFVTHFRQLQFKFVGHSSWARDSKNNFVYSHSFSSKFQSNSSPRCKGQITLDEFEWQNNEFVQKEWRIWSYIPNSLSDTDEFQWQLTNLNAGIFKFDWQKTNVNDYLTNWTLDLNAVSFSGRIELTIDDIEWRGDENGRENLY